MTRVTREERRKRRISALTRLQEGWGTGETIQYLMNDYGLTEDQQIWTWFGLIKSFLGDLLIMIIRKWWHGY